jgi:hypothetical protein
MYFNVRSFWKSEIQLKALVIEYKFAKGHFASSSETSTTDEHLI